MMPQNRKKGDGADNDEKEIVPNTTTTGTTNAIMFDEDMVVCDILSRIPAKSLMRFKSVSKPWRSLIKDPYFVDLHFTRSKKLLRFLFIIPTKISGINYQDHQVYFKTTAGLSSEGSGTVASNVPTIRNLRLARCTEIIGAVNGLICFVCGYDDAACIYNISTREITPWIKSTVLMEARKSHTCCYIGGPMYGFGSDPAGKKHKVICMWNISRKRDDGTIVTDAVCEVLTLGHGSWRKIEAAPPHHFYRTVSSVYVNGSVYWFPGIVECGDWNSGDNVFMVAFDVGSEKFRTIQISKPSDPVPFLDRCRLLEVNGCVAILRRNTTDTADLWVYEDSDKESTYKATTMDSTEKNWTKHTITLPVHWVEERDFYFHTASGADHIILETHLMNSDGRSKAVSVYSYDLKNKFFEEIKISGIPLSVPVCFDTRMCISFCENLLPLSEASQSTFSRKALVGFL